MKGKFVEIWVEIGAVIPTGNFRNSQPKAGAKIAIDIEEHPVSPEDVQKMIKDQYDAAWSAVSEQIFDRIQEIDAAVKAAGGGQR